MKIDEDADEEPAEFHMDKINKHLINDINMKFSIDKSIDKKYNEENGSVKFTIIMKLGITKQRKFKIIWQIDKNSDTARLISAYRKGENNNVF